MKSTNIKKLSIAGILCAAAVVGSLFSFPVFGSKCAPVQHMVNVFCAVLLGPGYGSICGITYKKYAGNRKSYGISGKHVWCISMWRSV